MITIKIGSKGEEVKLLQSLLNSRMNCGLVEDGIFGEKTKSQVESYQLLHNLTPDGIVGNLTWTSLGVVSTAINNKCIDPSVIYKPLSVHITKGRQTPQYLAIHYTAGASSQEGKAQSVYNTFVSRNASADFAVDDKNMVQFNPDINNYYCWSVGDSKNKYSSGATLYGKATNKNTISIEICSNRKSGTSSGAANHSGWYFTEEALNNAVKLAKIIMKKYNIPIDRVVRHYDISGKLCPGVIGWNNETIYDTKGNKTANKSNSDQWTEFKKRLAN